MEIEGVYSCPLYENSVRAERSGVVDQHSYLSQDRWFGPSPLPPIFYSAFFLYTLASRVTANIVFLVYSYTISYFISASGVVRWNTYRKLTETNRKSCLSGEKTSPLLPAVVV